MGTEPTVPRTLKMLCDILLTSASISSSVDEGWLRIWKEDVDVEGRREKRVGDSTT